jgi:hypothetical protein
LTVHLNRLLEFLNDKDVTIFLPREITLPEVLSIGILSWGSQDKATHLAKSLEFRAVALRSSINGVWERDQTFSASDGFSIDGDELIARDGEDFVVFTVDLNAAVVLRTAQVKDTMRDSKDRPWNAKEFLVWSGLDKAPPTDVLVP